MQFPSYSSRHLPHFEDGKKNRRRVPTIQATRKRCNGALDRVGIGWTDHAQLDPDRSHRLDCGKLANSGSNSRITQNRRSRHAWRDLLEQFEPFRADGIFDGPPHGRASGVLAFDPMRRAARTIPRVLPLRHDAFQAELAGVMED
jgi:hypothetical protein